MDRRVYIYARGYYKVPLAPKLMMYGMTLKNALNGYNFHHYAYYHIAKFALNCVAITLRIREVHTYMRTCHIIIILSSAALSSLSPWRVVVSRNFFFPEFSSKISK